MNRPALIIPTLILLCVALSGCGGDVAGKGGHIAVKHILIAVGPTAPVTPFTLVRPVSRTPEDARVIAEQILRKAQAGEDFDKLMATYSDDSPPGTYTMSDNGVAANPGEYPRANVPVAFGNISFSLKVGEVGMAPFDPFVSPAGFHIIKRIR